MAIITISRGSYQKGKEVAEKVARKLGYECISREILLEASDEFKRDAVLTLVSEQSFVEGGTSKVMTFDQTDPNHDYNN